MSIYITQLLYVKEGQEEIFHQFEDIAMPLIPKYKGKLLMRIRLHSSDIIEKNINDPYEIHLVEFETEKCFDEFMHDKERDKFLHLKKQSIQSVLLIKGTTI